MCRCFSAGTVRRQPRHPLLEFTGHPLVHAVHGHSYLPDVSRILHGDRQPPSGLCPRPDGLCDLGIVPALLQTARTHSRGGNHRPARGLVGPVRRRPAAVLEAPGLVARAAPESAALRRAGRQRTADRQQLDDLCLGGEQRPHAGSQPGLLHQSADQRDARHVAAQGTPASPAMAGGGPGFAGRGAAGLATRQPALGVAGAGPDLRLLRPDPQKAPVAALPGLVVETWLLLPLALVWLLFFADGPTSETAFWSTRKPCGWSPRAR